MRLVLLLAAVAIIGLPVARGQKRTARPVAASTAAPVVAFSTAESACFAQKKVLYSADGKCYDLVKRGPCTAGHWLVLDLHEAVNGSGALRPVCRQCPCCDSPLKIFWPADNRCRKTTENLCTHAGTEPTSDPFGEGECACVSDPPHLRYEPDARDPSVEKCYQLYTRGPCRRREILVAHLMPGFGRVARCASDPCYKDNEKRPYRPHGLHYATGRCHELRATGPCAGDNVFRLREDTLTPACVSYANNLFDNTDRRCADEDMGPDGCPPEVQQMTAEQHHAFMWNMATSVKKKRKTKKRGKSEDVRGDEIVFE